jgi:mRNA interferase RelE/StbE
VLQRVEEICADPYDIRTSKPLHGSLADARSSRLGELRITFRVVREHVVVVVVRIGPRGDIYKA